MNKKVFRCLFLLPIIIIGILVFNNYRCYSCGSYPANEIYPGNYRMCHECYTELTEGFSDNYEVFTNKYGTRDTLCFVGGCNNKIASTGDTNCCIEHSKRCLECNGYIDGDATYCMSCLEKATN